MLTRFALHSPLSDIQTAFSVNHVAKEPVLPRYNVSIGQDIPVIFPGHARDITLSVATWGNAPVTEASSGWSELLKKYPEKRRSFLRQRCILPVNGFFGWKRLSDTVAIPFYFRLLSAPIFAVAGVYSLDEEQQTLGVTSLNVSANTLIEPLEATMPAIIQPDDVEAWLNPMLGDEEAIAAMLQPHKTSDMSGYRVGNAVNSPHIDEVAVIDPVV
ncbi:MAG: hypothetical protein HLUCCA01_05925 [Bacteroidetes bacterium HLUCCA01]|nr:MAG: hypothetical protein HLUCCA01_05925 [Bacteroidetes bacterium HLUCCA01]